MQIGKKKPIFLLLVAILLVSILSTTIVTAEACAPRRRIRRWSLVLVKVENPDGTRAKYVTVEIYESDGALVKSSSTNRWGFYLTLLRRYQTYTVKVSKDGLTAETTLKTWRLLHRVKLTLEPSCTQVTVHVQDSSGEPIETLVKIFDNNGDLYVSGSTNSNGDYTTCLENGDYFASAVDPDTGNDTGTQSFTVPDDTTVTITI